ncbi:unnamed protein product [Phytophthora lilii]|uniref:Unnamed protein product n=1 Tax=Phytophthora lilii TaxID=2077276 RepID=A0A9W6X5L0_9STRA|nr:unnamed protein product [Phytophthora lilii]
MARRGSSSFFDRVRLAVQELAANEDEKATANGGVANAGTAKVGLAVAENDATSATEETGAKEETATAKDAKPASPRTSDLFGRLMSAMRNEMNDATLATSDVKRPSVTGNVVAGETKSEEVANEQSEHSEHGETSSHSVEDPVTETDNVQIAENVQEEVETVEQTDETNAVQNDQEVPEVVPVVQDEVDIENAAIMDAGVEDEKVVGGETESQLEADVGIGKVSSNGDRVVVEEITSSSDANDSRNEVFSPPQEVETVEAVVDAPPQHSEPTKATTSPPPSASRLFGRLMSAMRAEQHIETNSTSSTTDRRETGNRASITASTSENVPSIQEPASTSLFDRLISTVRHETPTPTTAKNVDSACIAHAEITVDEGAGGDDTSDNGAPASSESNDNAYGPPPKPPSDSQNGELEAELYGTVSNDPALAEAAAIEGMVELTLDVGGDDQEDANDVEPSTCNDNETVAENHDSEPSVTNEIDHVEEHYPEELKTAIQRAGAALLTVLPNQEAAGVSAECYSAIERMKNDGEAMSMEFVKELETSGVLMTCANQNAEQTLKAAEADLAELRVSVAACCTGRLAWTAIPELLALWSIVHTSISDGISDEAGEKGNILEPFEIARAAERKATLLNLDGFERTDSEKVEVDNSIFDEQLAQAALAQAMAGLQGSLLVSRQRLAATLQAMREGRAALVGGCLALVNIPPLLRLEIARDFFQTAGLFLSGMFKPTLKYFEHQELPEYVMMLVRGLRAAYTIIAIDVSAFIQWISKFTNAGVFISIGVVMLAHIFFITWLYKVTRYMPRGANNVRHGHEATTWASLAETNKRMAMISSLLITASLTAYLPLTQFCFSVLDINAHKDEETVNIEGTVASHFVKKPYWGLVVFEAIALLITFSIPLPFVLVSSIRSNRPRGSLENAKVTYDLDGEEVPFDDKVYARLVASDPSQLRCPYRSLYNGFEQRWSTYKVMQLVAKAILAAVVVGSSRNVSTGGIIVCGVYFCIVLLTSVSRPFIDPVNDLMESSAKFTALVTAVGGTLGAWAQRNDIHSNYIQGFLGFVLVVHFANLWVMLTVTLLGVANTRTLIKNWLGWLSFSDTTRMIDDARAQDIIPLWDLNKEAKHRVWQAFWRAVLYDLAPKENDAEDHSEHRVRKSPAAARLISLDQAVVTAGIRRVSSHWRGKQQRYTTRLRQVVRTALEGVDVYWNEETGVRDGHLDSKSFFGKMYVVPYPFHCVIVYDNTADEAIIWDEVDESAPRDDKLHSNLAKLLFLNFSPPIVAKRELRQKIRVLADLKATVRFPFSRVETAVVDDYYEWTPIEGRKPMKIHYKAVVEFTCHYTFGVFKVKSSGDAVIKGGAKRAMADGFIVSMTYKDGRGYAKAPRTGKRFEITGRKAVRDSDHFELNPDMEENEHLKQIFKQTQPIWEAGIKKMRADDREYRRKLIEIHAEANNILSDDFWYFVYNNQYLSRKDLEHYLTTRETNPLLRQLPQTHRVALDALYLRQRFIMLSPAHKLWYIFWDDVFARNSDMSRLIPRGEPKPGRACRSDFDPNSATSICYNKKSREDLEAWLAERGLLSRAGMFHPGLLQLLYDEMKKLDEGADPKNLMKVRPGGRSFKRRSMIASMVWRPTA